MRVERNDCCIVTNQMFFFFFWCVYRCVWALDEFANRKKRATFQENWGLVILLLFWKAAYKPLRAPRHILQVFGAICWSLLFLSSFNTTASNVIELVLAQQHSGKHSLWSKLAVNANYSNFSLITNKTSQQAIIAAAGFLFLLLLIPKIQNKSGPRIWTC